MNQKLIHYSIILFGFAAVFYPLWVARGGAIFPLFGILAFTLLWLHSISGAFEGFLRNYINFDRFVSVTAAIILACIILHPLLLLVTFNFNIFDVFSVYGVPYVLLGMVGWLLLITYDISKPLKKYHQFFVQHWNRVLIISNIGFLITFFHSLYLGSDLQSGPLRVVWIFYGVTAAAAILYTYVIKNRFRSGS